MSGRSYTLKEFRIMNNYYGKHQASRTTNHKAADLGSMLNLAAYIGNAVGVSAADIESLSLDSLKQLRAEEGGWHW